MFVLWTSFRIHIWRKCSNTICVPWQYNNISIFSNISYISQLLFVVHAMHKWLDTKWETWIYEILTTQQPSTSVRPWLWPFFRTNCHHWHAHNTFTPQIQPSQPKWNFQVARFHAPSWEIAAVMERNSMIHWDMKAPVAWRVIDWNS